MANADRPQYFTLPFRALKDKLINLEDQNYSIRQSNDYSIHRMEC
jgi:hypothetical protein